jgi:hypothetical protein
MGAPRRLARGLLRAVVRLAPAPAREWASAMLRELDFVEGEWAALAWALGSAAAIVRLSARNWRYWIDQFNSGRKQRMNSGGRKAVGVISGAVSALMLVGCAFGLLRLVDLLAPSLGIAHLEWTHWLSIIVIPEIIFVAAAILLWRKRGPIAAGILLVAIAVGLHVAIHVARH